MNHVITTLSLSGLFMVLNLLLLLGLLRKKIPNHASPIINHLVAWVSTIMLLGITKQSNLFEFEVSFAFALIFFADAVCFFVFGIIYKSLSLRFLLVTAANNGTLPLGSLDALVTQKTFGDRIDILLKMRLVEQQENYYTCTQHGEKLSNTLRWVKKIFKIHTSGLYQSRLDQDTSTD